MEVTSKEQQDVDERLAG